MIFDQVDRIVILWNGLIVLVLNLNLDVFRGKHDEFVRSANRSVNDNLSLEIGLIHTFLLISNDLHLFDFTLSVSKIWSRKSFMLSLLKFSIFIVETLWFISCGSGQIFEGFKLPIGPAYKVFIADVSHLVDLSDANIWIKTGPELTDDKRDSKPLGVLLSGSYSFLVPFKTLRTLLNSWFSCCAHIRRELAAVSVLIKGMIAWSNLASWGSFKTKLKNKSSCNTFFVRKLSWLKHHHIFHVALYWGVGLNLLKNFRVKRSQFSLVELLWQK